MLIFYIVCGCLVFFISALVLQFNRLAIYRRRIIVHFSKQAQHKPFILNDQQEQQIKQHFLRGDSIQICINKLKLNGSFTP